jgi:tetratricopeptide (TPR) repeat protein
LKRWQTPVNIALDDKEHLASRFKLFFPMNANLLWEKVPFFILSIISSILTIWIQNKDGAVASLQKFPFSERILNAIVSYAAYLGKIFWPVDMAVFYPYDHSLPVWQVAGAAVIIAGISITVFRVAKKMPFLAVGWFWYLGTLFPVNGFMQTGMQAMADRYTYLPSIGIGIMLAWGISYLLPQEKLRKTTGINPKANCVVLYPPLRGIVQLTNSVVLRTRNWSFTIILIPSATAAIAVLAVLTWQNCGYWENSITLFNHALNVTKNNYLAHVNLAMAWADRGEYEEAIKHYRNVLKVAPDNEVVHYNLGYFLEKQGKIEEAIKHYREAVRLKPNYLNALNNLGICLRTQRRYDEAILYYRRALQIDPKAAHLRVNLGAALLDKGEPKEAIEHLQAAVNLSPDFKYAQQLLRRAQELARRQKK